MNTSQVYEARQLPGHYDEASRGSLSYWKCGLDRQFKSNWIGTKTTESHCGNSYCHNYLQVAKVDKLQYTIFDFECFHFRTLHKTLANIKCTSSK